MLLIFHGSVVLLAGFLSGSFMGIAINRGKAEATVRGWRVAHSGLITGGMLMLLLGLIVPYLSLSGLSVTVLVWSLVVSGYGFAVALPLGAWSGQRGLKASPAGVNTAVYIGNMIGAGGSFVAAFLLIYGCWRAL